MDCTLRLNINYPEFRRYHHKPRSNKAVRYNSFTIRIVEDWNSLNEDIVSSKTVLQFKTKLDKFWINKRYDDSEIY